MQKPIRVARIRLFHGIHRYRIEIWYCRQSVGKQCRAHQVRLSFRGEQFKGKDRQPLYSRLLPFRTGSREEKDK